jgi:hypothetical protein
LYAFSFPDGRAALTVNLAHDEIWKRVPKFEYLYCSYGLHDILSYREGCDPVSRDVSVEWGCYGMNIGISVVSDADSDFCVHQIVQTDFSGQ